MQLLSAQSEGKHSEISISVPANEGSFLLTKNNTNADTKLLNRSVIEKFLFTDTFLENNKKWFCIIIILFNEKNI